MKKLLKLFFIFMQVGGCTFGGGYAMLSLLQRVVVDKYHWATEEELMDYYAIGQCTPGIIAINTSTFIGYKQAGLLGAIAATVGFAVPSIVIITVIAAFIQNFAELEIVKHALAGIRVGVCVLIFDAVVKLGKKALINVPSIILFAVIALLAVFTDISTIVLIVAAGVAGYVMYRVGGKKA